MKRTIVALASIMTMTTGAWALEPSGTYTYKEKGYTGDMTVSRVNDNEASWKINILTVQSSSANMCEVEGVINNMMSDDKTVEAVFVSPDEDSGKFTVAFTKSGALVDVSDNKGFCGMNADFSGKWSKAVAKSKSKKMKK
ncbi:MAG: hypothetical protein PHP95_14065 [Desulfuromonadaceae bacterium]|nr:hypothetical protein [Desulfuromonadaceae bacterium]MDD2849574.1 hypothetical protein [Desulfuromonadaceae bacterium]MDD4132000.1 hypothetical protein [Desulfuromonadaceae bacterium]